jgi:thiamine biosynthesis lipoprotein
MGKFVYKFSAMSTSCEVTLYADKKIKADSVARAILNETKRLEKKYNYYNKDSLLNQINTRATKELDNETKSLLNRAKDYYKQTDGIFDITVATIKNLYTQTTTIKELDAQKKTLSEFVGCEHFEIKKNKILFDNEFTTIDLGGFVKEYAVDRAVNVVKKNKISSALINYGGDIYALGVKPDGKKFKVGIKNPQNPKEKQLEVELQDEALTTSASYERNYKIQDKTYSHILSKAKNASISASISVISAKCVESGVYSTSMMINPNIKTKNRVIVL